MHDPTTTTRGGGDAGAFLNGDLQLFQTKFEALNNSGVSGQAYVLFDMDARTVTVDIRAEGLEPGQVHPQHIHGFADDRDARNPTIRDDTDRDGFVELAEGLAGYGPIQLNLSTAPDDPSTFKGMTTAFPTADADGTLRYRATFDLGEDAGDEGAVDLRAIFDAITPGDAKEIVLHGIELPEGFGEGTEGEVNGDGGYIAVLPVATGELEAVDDAADVLQAVGELGLMHAGIIDWNAVAAQVTANFEATGQWYL
jgi:hypothetical protein